MPDVIQTYSVAAHILAVTMRHAVEFIEYERQTFRRDSDSVVGHGNAFRICTDCYAD